LKGEGDEKDISHVYPLFNIDFATIISNYVS